MRATRLGSAPYGRPAYILGNASPAGIRSAKISGLPNRAGACSGAETQDDTSMRFDRRHASTPRLVQSMIELRCAARRAHLPDRLAKNRVPPSAARSRAHVLPRHPGQHRDRRRPPLGPAAASSTSAPFTNGTVAFQLRRCSEVQGPRKFRARLPNRAAIILKPLGAI
jgi:hypothetical protein